LNKSKIVLEHVTVRYHNGRKPWFRRWRQDHPKSGDGAPKEVLEGVSLEIGEGEFVCILGHSGCGKSTLLKVIAGFIQPDDGAVYVDGVKVKGPQADHIFVFQEGALFPWLTIGDNVSLALRSIKDRDERTRHVQSHLEQVALEGVEKYYPFMLSGGMRQRAEIARALAAKPEILLMDEPFSGLDYLTRLHLREEMLYLHIMLPQTTILFVTHDIDEALQLSNRLIVMSEPPGQVKCCQTIDLSHPRTLASPVLGELRSQIYHHLGVHVAI
jgi:ABC-type nitrate/sulfonate/bicarbonate transport system ATPase subunit